MDAYRKYLFMNDTNLRITQISNSYKNHIKNIKPSFVKFDFFIMKSNTSSNLIHLFFFHALNIKPQRFWRNSGKILESAKNS